MWNIPTMTKKAMNVEEGLIALNGWMEARERDRTESEKWC